MNRKQKGLLFWMLALLAVLALGAGLEAVLTSLQTPEWSTGSFARSEFTTDEMEDRGDGVWYTLARNSYFEIAGLDCGPVGSILFDFEPEAGDTTERVTVCDCSINGVRGEFVFPIYRGEGGWRADLNCDALYAIRIYPTETVRSTLRFAGCSFAPGPEAVFSAADALIFALCFAALALAVRLFFRRSPTDCWWTAGVGTAAFCGLAVLLAGKIYTALSATSLLAAAAAGAGALAVAFLRLCCAVPKLYDRLFLLLLAAGVLFALGGAPLQVPDESIHFLRAWSISEGDFTFDYNADYPDDVSLLCELFPGEFYNEIHETGKGSVRSRLGDYFDRVDMPYGGARFHSSIQLILPYAFPALLLAIARLFGANALICFYIGRMGGALLYALCARFALQRACRYRTALIAFLTVPIGVYLAASFSYDSMLLCAFAVLLGCVLSDRFAGRETALFLISFSVILMIKPIYLPICLLIFLIPKERLKAGKLNRPMLALLAAAVGMLVWYASILYASAFAQGMTAVRLQGVNYTAQILQVLTNPLRYALVMLVDGWMNAFYLGEFGAFGYLDVTLPLTAILTPIVALLCAGLGAVRTPGRRRGDTLLLVSLAAGIYLLVVTSFYVTWSSLGATSILGVQVRYFLIVVFLLCAALSRLFGRLIVPLGERIRSETAAVTLCGAALYLACAELFVRYFLM